MGPLDFAWAHIGDRLTAPNGDGGECVDLANLWLLEAYNVAHVYRNAVDWATTAVPKFKWVPNLPNNGPTPGCLVVWQHNPYWGIGINGHIALCLCASTHYIVSLDQNWPEGSPARIHLHD